MAQLKRNEETYRRIFNRQWQDRWHSDYDAAMHATPHEAPSASRPSILRPGKLGGRAFHTLSQTETWSALLALYNPNVWDVHEQRILYPTPRANFLANHPRSRGISFKPFAGTLDVADRLGLLSKHPKFRVCGDDSPDGMPVTLPFFYLGDLLIFIEDKLGVYAVNWNIKGTEQGFRTRLPYQFKAAPDPRNDSAVINRHLIEENYYLDAGIRTQRITKDRFHFDLRCNLFELFLDHSLEIKINQEERLRAYEFFNEAIGASVLANSVCREVSARYNLTLRDAIALLRQGVWLRKIRVDLFRPFLMNKPLYREREDPLVHYASWFKR
ncbi:hypothetical protein MASR2M16_13770 [Thauera terpenica]